MVTLRAKSKIDNLEDVKKVLAEQHHPWVERKIQQLKMGDSEPNVVSLQKEVESLELKIKQMQERIRVLENK